MNEKVEGGVSVSFGVFLLTVGWIEMSRAAWNMTLVLKERQNLIPTREPCAGLVYISGSELAMVQ